jgi:hypothetical protein
MHDRTFAAIHSTNKLITSHATCDFTIGAIIAPTRGSNTPSMTAMRSRLIGDHRPYEGQQRVDQEDRPGGDHGDHRPYEGQQHELQLA